MDLKLTGKLALDALAKEQGKSGAEFEKEFFEQVRPTSLLKRFVSPF